jgi:hypothetical protein
VTLFPGCTSLSFQSQHSPPIFLPLLPTLHYYCISNVYHTLKNNTASHQRCLVAAYTTLMSTSTAAQKQLRRTTWPNIQSITTNMSKSNNKTPSPPATDDIDQDPFSHFLSPVLDEDDPFDGLDYNAGIDSPFEEDVEQKRTTFRVRLEEKWGNFLSARRSPSPQKSQQTPPRTPPSEDQLPELIIDDLEGFGSPSSSPPTRLPSLTTLKDIIHEEDEEEADGWEADRRRSRILRRKNNFHLDEQDRPVTAPSRAHRPKLQRPRYKRFRTLSGRPHSFVAPSPHLWTVSEHDEILEQLRNEMRGRRSSR